MKEKKKERVGERDRERDIHKRNRTKMMEITKKYWRVKKNIKKYNARETERDRDRERERERERQR